MKTSRNWLYGLPAGLLVLVGGAYIVVNLLFARLTITPFYDDCQKVWAHRGYWKLKAGNTIPAFQQAFELGAKGVELDIHYDFPQERFVVAHNYPYELVDGKLVFLDEVFAAVGQQGYFWIDFKNLQKMKRSEAELVAQKFATLLAQHNLQHKVIVESKSAGNLVAFSQRAIATSYWLGGVNRQTGTLTRLSKIFSYKLRFLWGNFSAISIDSDNFTPEMQSAFSHVPVHLFTVDDQREILRYQAVKNIRIILSNENFYQLNSCAPPSRSVN